MYSSSFVVKGCCKPGPSFRHLGFLLSISIHLLNYVWIAFRLKLPPKTKRLLRPHRFATEPALNSALLSS